MKKASFFLGVIISLISLNGFSQDGSPDLTFGDNGIVISDIQGGSDLAYAVVQQNNGSFIIAGGADIEGNHSATLVRYLPNGIIDNTFGVNGKVWNDYNVNYSEYFFITSQNDNKIISGTNIYINGIYTTILTRYFPDGDLDVSFADNGNLIPFINSSFKGLVFQDNNTFIIAGWTLNNNVSEINLRGIT